MTSINYWWKYSISKDIYQFLSEQRNHSPENHIKKLYVCPKGGRVIGPVISDTRIQKAVQYIIQNTDAKTPDY